MKLFISSYIKLSLKKYRFKIWNILNIPFRYMNNNNSNNKIFEK